MKTTFNKSYLVENKSCYSISNIEDMYPTSADDVPLTAILELNFPLGDKLFFLLKKCDLTNRQKHELVILVVEVALAIYESSYPKFTVARETIDLAKKYLVDTVTIEELRKKKTASAIFTALAVSDSSKKIKPVSASESALAINSVIQSIDLNDIEMKNQSPFVDNASTMAVNSTVNAIESLQPEGKKEFTDLITQRIIAFVSEQ